MSLDSITDTIIACCIAIHRKLGPGLLESTYEACLEHDLRKRGLKIERQKSMPLVYDNLLIENAYRIDLLVEDSVVLELKAVEEVHPVHKAQLLSYLKLSGKSVGLLLNFHAPLMKDGITRMVNNH